MDFDEKKKRQTIRVIIAEIGMVLSVVAIVVVSTMAAMGFMISGNGGIEQSGLMQLHSLPTGASVKIDGNAVFSRTNLSRTLSAGAHFLEISRDGYDTWQKTINIEPGVLLRVYYPRLFLQNRVAEKVKTLTKNELEFYTVSNNRNFVLYAEKDSSEWQLLDIRGDEVKVTPLDLSGTLPGMIEEKADTKKANVTIEKHQYKFSGKIEEIRWTSSEESVLVRVSYDERSEWILVKFKDIANSVNISRDFGLSNDVKIAVIDNTGSQIYALERRQLRRVNVSDGVMSRVLLENVLDFANFGANVVYLAAGNDGDGREIGVYRDNEKGGTIIEKIQDDVTVEMALASYYGDDYVVWTAGDKLTVYYGRLPNYTENEPDLSGLEALIKEIKLSETPLSLSISPGNQYAVAQKAKKMMVVDFETGDLYEYDSPLAGLRWFDASMMYATVNGEINVWDFDGTNKRNLAESVGSEKMSAMTDAAVVVTANNRWMYYLSDESDEIVLVRERIQ